MINKIEGYCLVCNKSLFVVDTEREFKNKSSKHILHNHRNEDIDRPIVTRRKV